MYACINKITKKLPQRVKDKKKLINFLSFCVILVLKKEEKVLSEKK